MKRRAFLALAGGLAVTPGSVLAAKKTNTNTSSKPAAKATAKKPAGKAGAKAAPAKSNARGNTANLRPSAPNQPPAGHVTGMALPVCGGMQM